MTGSVFRRAGTLLMLGLPGAGKGTQAHEISQEFGVPAISTGVMLRDAVHQHTPLGLKARPIMESGQFVPDALVSSLVEERTAKPDCAHGFILDGFPRNLDQAAFLDQLLRVRELAPALALYIHVDPDVLFKRLAGRRECPTCGAVYNVYLSPALRQGLCDRDGSDLIQRKDDCAETIRMRFSEFESQTRPVITHYREQGALYTVEGNREPHSVTEEIFRLLRSC